MQKMLVALKPTIPVLSSASLEGKSGVKMPISWVRKFMFVVWRIKNYTKPSKQCSACADTSPHLRLSYCSQPIPGSHLTLTPTVVLKPRHAGGITINH